MKRLLLILLVLLISVWLGATIAIDPGYVLVAYHKTSIESPLWFAIILLFASFLIFYSLVRLWRNTRALPNRLRNRSTQKHNRNTQELTHQGLLALWQGKTSIAEKKLVKSAINNNLGWINYLFAAQAAHDQNSFEKRDSYLREAYKNMPSAETAANIHQAQFHIDQQHPEHAITILEKIRQKIPNHPFVLRQLTKIHTQLHNWDSFLSLIPQLRKNKILPAPQINVLEQTAYQRLLFSTGTAGNMETLKSLWHKIPRAYHENSLLVHTYTKFLHENNQAKEAESLIRKTLANTWDKNLVREYGLIKSEKTDQQLNHAEAWLKGHPHDPVLLLTLGRLSARNQLWGKARNYFEASIAQQPQAEAYWELGKLLEQLNEPKSAMECFKKGLELVTNN